MKITPLALSVMIASLFLLSACKKDKEDENYMRAKVDGVAWKATDLQVLPHPSSANLPHRIVGTDNVGNVITLKLPAPATGTYSFRLWPAALIRFTITAEQSQLHFQWETSAEVNTSHFIVESSADNLNWTQYFEEPATGTAHVYEKIVSTAGVSYQRYMYYRLKTVDTDNRFTYSPIIYVNMDYTAYYKPAGEPGWTGTDGVLEITTLDTVKHLVAGHFHFTINPGFPYDIANGEFRTSY